MSRAIEPSKNNAEKVRGAQRPHRHDPPKSSTAFPSPINIARLREDLRTRLETKALRKPGRGGTYTPEICPACGEDRKGNPWWGKRGNPDRMCERCFREGKPFPDPVSAPEKKPMIPRENKQ